MELLEQRNNLLRPSESDVADIGSDAFRGDAVALLKILIELWETLIT